MKKEIKDKTVYVRIPPVTEKWIQDKIDSGAYKNASEVINYFLTQQVILGR